ncbi:50S ribosomal protein L18 [Candidatus Sneabacter namystus]|uniref:Large ribosomal subunit protein uL18 n=1 Tax=Candidatus Sneabacter namystus TaxID=2601646 RepID=A0A5C0UK23_9RICK|nr:50S ribosomal protein L18 [Candidatus Sneabacter namystus]QEK39782.1 50S ribosomal protein L18 [Candidatus Sneabacter namystus]
MIKNKKRIERRKSRVRNKIAKVASEYNRLSITKSRAHISCQIFSVKKDGKTYTLASASSMENSLRKKSASNCNKDMATKVGGLIADRASNAGITKVVFDRGQHKYHGIVKAFCDAARSKLNF